MSGNCCCTETQYWYSSGFRVLKPLALVVETTHNLLKYLWLSSWYPWLANGEAKMEIPDDLYVCLAAV